MHGYVPCARLIVSGTLGRGNVNRVGTSASTKAPLPPCQRTTEWPKGKVPGVQNWPGSNIMIKIHECIHKT